MIEASNCVVLVLNACGENGARLRRSDIAVTSCPSTEQLLDGEQLLAKLLLAEQLLDASCPSTEQLLDAERLLTERLLAEQLLDAEHFLTDDWHELWYEPRISSSSSRGEVFARAHHRKGSLHRSAEKGFCCILSRSCGYRI